MPPPRLFAPRLLPGPRRFSTTSRRFSTTPHRLSTPPPPNTRSRVHHYAKLFAGKPASYFTSFLILHELTAIVPVAGLFWYFQTIDWVPKWMRLELPAELLAEKKEYVMRKAREKGYEQWVSGDSEKGAKMLVDLATAYVLVKIALPGRIALSLVVVPWFARRAVEPVGRVLGRVWRGVARWKR